MTSHISNDPDITLIIMQCCHKIMNSLPQRRGWRHLMDYPSFLIDCLRTMRYLLSIKLCPHKDISLHYKRTFDFTLSMRLKKKILNIIINLKRKQCTVNSSLKHTKSLFAPHSKIIHALKAHWFRKIVINSVPNKFWFSKMRFWMNSCLKREIWSCRRWRERKGITL